jgi:hypothetical protein
MFMFKIFQHAPKSMARIVTNSHFSKLQKFNFSSYELEVPTIQLDKFINKNQGWEQECKIAAECLHDTGILVVKDSVYKI